MILNRQGKYAVDLPALRAYVGSLKGALGLGEREFNICLIADREMARLNAAYRATPRPTDVLSFPWRRAVPAHPVLVGVGARPGILRARLPIASGQVAVPLPDGGGPRRGELNGFLGDVAISVETARRNARREGHSTLNEIRWLVLHGVLHLLGYDHERDRGEMTLLEHALRERLGIAAQPAARRRPPLLPLLSKEGRKGWSVRAAGRRGWRRRPKRAKGSHG